MDLLRGLGGYSFQFIIVSKQFVICSFYSLDYRLEPCGACNFSRSRAKERTRLTEITFAVKVQSYPSTTHYIIPCRYHAWVDHLNSVIEAAPLSTRLDVPLLRRADTEATIPQRQLERPITTTGRPGSKRSTIAVLLPFHVSQTL